MIILIFGKSGSGKTYLAEYLKENLDNSIHLDIDELNSDLYHTPNVQEYAKQIFGENILVGKKIDKQLLYSNIKDNKELYNNWVDYMIDSCQRFIDGYISSTSFDYYIIDHINSHLFQFETNVLKILCEENDNNIRYARLQKRDKISQETINFRDKHYIECDGDITYNGTNIENILNAIKENKKNRF